MYALFVLLIQFLKKKHLSFVKFCFIFVWYIKFCIYWLNESTIKLACCVISIKRVDIHFKFLFIDGTFYSTVREFNVTERHSELSSTRRLARNKKYVKKTNASAE